MDALYPFNAVDNSPPWPFLPLVIGGLVTFTLLVLVVYGRE
jgi:hypothetical protein